MMSLMRTFSHKLFVGSRVVPVRLLSTVRLAYAEYKPDTQNNTHSQPLVILHGLYGSKNDWPILSRKMAHNLNTRVIAVDLRNHGESPHTQHMNYQLMAADVTDLVTSLDIGSMHLLGHSMGGRVAMRIALDQPEFLKSLIIEDALPSSVDPQQFARYMEAMMKIDMQMPNGSLVALRKRAMNELEEVVPDIGIRTFLVQILASDGQSDIAKWEVNVKGIYDNWAEICNWQDDNKQFTGPTCFIGGATSQYLPSGKYTAVEKQAISKPFPKAEYHVIDAGHWIHSEQPEKFMDTVCAFLKAVR